MIRARFRANEDDYRPINWPVKHPYWCTGYGNDYSVVVAYADDIDEILRNWPEATDIDFEEREEYIFTDRFQKPEWFQVNAREFAIRAHKDQMYGKDSYYLHLDAVVKVLESYVESLESYGPDIKTLGYLHDVFEDTDVSREKLERNFGAFMLECVELVTDESGKNRKDRKTKTYKKFKKIDKESMFNIVLIVKAADRLVNMIASQLNNKSLLKMYIKEYVDFRDAVYRPGLCDELWKRIEEVVSSEE